MDVNKIKSLIASITSSLQDASIGELLFMHHTTLETVDMLAEFGDDELMGYCAGLEQAIYNEIHRRIDNGEINLTDPQDFYGKLKDYYDKASNSVYGDQIKASFINMRRKKSKKGIEKHGKEFFEKYRKELGLKEKKTKLKIPSPDEIIRGKTPKGIPNN